MTSLKYHFPRNFSKFFLKFWWWPIDAGEDTESFTSISAAVFEVSRKSGSGAESAPQWGAGEILKVTWIVLYLGMSGASHFGIVTLSCLETELSAKTEFSDIQAIHLTCLATCFTGGSPTCFGLGRGPITPPGPAMVRTDRKDLNSNKTKQNWAQNKTKPCLVMSSMIVLTSKLWLNLELIGRGVVSPPQSGMEQTSIFPVFQHRYGWLWEHAGDEGN